MSGAGGVKYAPRARYLRRSVQIHVRARRKILIFSTYKLNRVSIEDRMMRVNLLHSEHYEAGTNIHSLSLISSFEFEVASSEEVY